MQDFIQELVLTIRDLPTVVKMLALILSVTIEYIFPIFPGDTIVLLAGFLKAYDALLLVDICIAVVIGTLLGSSLAYGAGRLIYAYKDRTSLLKKIVEHPHYLKFGEWYRRWGLWFLLFNRFFPGIRALFFLVAGVEKLPFLHVLFFGGLSAILYNACLVLLGYVLGFKAELIIQYFYQYNAIALGLLLVVILSAAFLFWRATKK